MSPVFINSLDEADEWRGHFVITPEVNCPVYIPKDEEDALVLPDNRVYNDGEDDTI